MKRAFCILFLFAYAHSLDITLNVSDVYQVNSTDASVGIQNALDSIGQSGGGTLTLGDGVYVVSEHLEVPANTVLQGQGMNKTIIKLMDYAPPFKVGTRVKSGILRASYQIPGGCNNIAFKQLTVDGNKDAQIHDEEHKYGRYGLFTESCENVLIDSVEIYNMQAYGFDPHGKKPTKYARTLTIVNCISHDNDWDGFTLDQTVGVVVQNCTSYNNGRHGFNVVTGTTDANITDCTTYNNGYYYYTGDPGCGVAVQANMGYNTSFVRLGRMNISGDKKAGVCTVANITNLTVFSSSINNGDRCIHLGTGANFVTVYNIACVASKFLSKSSTTTSLILVNNTLNGQSVKDSGTLTRPILNRKLKMSQ